MENQLSASSLLPASQALAAAVCFPPCQHGPRAQQLFQCPQIHSHDVITSSGEPPDGFRREFALCTPQQTELKSHRTVCPESPPLLDRHQGVLFRPSPPVQPPGPSSPSSQVPPALFCKVVLLCPPMCPPKPNTQLRSIGRGPHPPGDRHRGDK